MLLNKEMIGLRSMAASLAPRRLELAELADRQLLRSSPGALAEMGFEAAHLILEEDEIYDLALASTRRALSKANVRGEEVDALIWSSALPAGHCCSGDNSFLGIFNYPASKLQWELGLENAMVTGVAQQGCCSLFNALNQAVLLLQTHPEWKHILCVAADALPVGSTREILYNVISDAACAVVISREEVRYRWRCYNQITKGYYWNVAEKEKEIIAAYFPTSRLILRGLLESEGGASSLDRLIATGVSPASWKLLAGWSGIPEEKLYLGRRKFGHTIASDNILKWLELEEDGLLHNGDRLLCFTYGFGSSWAGFTVEALAL